MKNDILVKLQLVNDSNVFWSKHAEVRSHVKKEDCVTKNPRQ